eukprot:TRINITY_DN7643_c0_g1_i1.p1 TRINITY_DN7643_c0_g1~~TRINITY_DN7643_c0_g1_i1.p1  ORF type:complete len:571 (-),score=121.75 TRINITY_DN7643_c0_g1_i1:112-1824(-)
MTLAFKGRLLVQINSISGDDVEPHSHYLLGCPLSMRLQLGFLTKTLYPYDSIPGSTLIFNHKVRFDNVNKKLRKYGKTIEHVPLIIEIYNMDDRISYTEIQLKDFRRGKMITKDYDLSGLNAFIRLGVQPLDFGDLDLPENDVSLGTPPSLKFIRNSEILRTRAELDLWRAPNKLHHFQEKHIKRKVLVASGTYGVVYKGKVKGLKMKVAIKDLDISKKDSVGNWKSEIEIMKIMDCRYVVRIYGYCYDEERLTIVMDFMRLGSLFDVLHRKCYVLSILHRIRMARHCLRAIVWLHGLDLVHRDVKSPNVMVSKNFSCKLSDFGCAKLYEKEGKHTPNVGSRLWMAPEVQTNEYGKPADVFSMGLVLYELLNDRLPAMNEVLGWSEVPNDCIGKGVILPCLEIEPNDRPTADSVLLTLDEWISDILMKVVKEVPKLVERSRRKTKSMDDDIIELYNYLVNKHPYEADDIIRRHVPIAPPSPEKIVQSNTFYEILNISESDEYSSSDEAVIVSDDDDILDAFEHADEDSVLNSIESLENVMEDDWAEKKEIVEEIGLENVMDGIIGEISDI